MISTQSASARSGQEMSFSVDVTDANKPQEFERVLPVMGSASRIRLDEYVPDLTWETSVVPVQKGGFVVELQFLGEDMDQTMYLVSDDPT